MMNYSQYDEQTHILRLLGHLPPDRSTFLDVGAYHPTSLSNTRALYELGWSGVLVEPSPEPFVSLLRAYGRDPRITLICAALALERNLTRLHATADALSTLEGDHAAKHLEVWGPTGGFYGSFLTHTITWEQILNRYPVLDFISIDTEGTSVELFRDYLALVHCPYGQVGPYQRTGVVPVSYLQSPLCSPASVILVEHNGQPGVAAAAAEDAGYHLEYDNDVNALYSRMDAQVGMPELWP